LYVAVIDLLAANSEPEPNNSAATATPSATPASPVAAHDGNITVAGDQDFYKAIAGAGDILFIALDADPARNGTGSDLVIDLYASDGVTLLLSCNGSTTTSMADYATEGALTRWASPETTMSRSAIFGRGINGAISSDDRQHDAAAVGAALTIFESEPNDTPGLRPRCR